MAVKTITIDLEAYSLLASRKREGQSFSNLIKEHLGRKTTAKNLLKVQDNTLKGLDGQVVQQRIDLAKITRI